ncbi:DUF4132 domain-containing protein [Janthinobacterium sp. NKUCC08_JDC]|uniref:DUF4132 domain-containing protein n=1 Tax=Janthinobacterium sp. NKUCC08_JDC TaxID=2842122 RepID=UPI001C5ADB9A|nr:DUF4132 domain-containing protein [Janthinobacterium sp. NKUCC08_JDC]MBW3499522.1 DUF4132 domain-containing protein [Janthinobacterium sp. NKUCC08_JDC]
MMETEVSSRAAALRARLEGAAVDHARFTGPPVDFNDWTPEELGAIWGALHRAARFGHDDIARLNLARTLLEQVTEAGLAPQLAGAVFLDALDAAAEYNGEWEYVIGCLACLQGEAPAGTAAQARRILGETSGWAERPYQAWLLARLAGDDTPVQFAQLMEERHARYPMPLTLQELALLPQLAQASLLALAGSPHSSFWNRDSIGEADPAEVLADDAAYVDFARTILEQAARHIAAIHDGSVPYAADAAFATADSPVLARAARVAAYRDDAWFRPVIAVLLPLACVAPGAAKSAPSQSLAMALGHAVETIPTPESLLALRTALAQVRHAGIRKKLERNLKPAERALAERPDIAWRIGMPGPMGKRRQAMLARRLEAGYASEVWFGLDQWRALRDDADIETVARALVWRTGDGQAFMLDGMGAIDAQGQPVQLPEQGDIGLWHPLHGSGEQRAAWQALLAQRRVRQPLRQVYREIYAPSGDGSAPFAGYQLSLPTLLGLARREGWRLDDDEGLSRQFGAWRVLLRLGGRVYPGAGGACTSNGLAPAQMMPMAPVAYSEACRAVDLLVSASALALVEEEQSAQREERLFYLANLAPGPMAGMRRTVLRQVFAQQIEAGRMALEPRHLTVGRHAIHLVTGRVTLDGAEVATEVLAKGNKLGAVPWLPHDEALLEKIVGLAGQLLKR